MVRLIAIAVAAFKAWMFIDAVRRRADTKWFYLIVFVPFGGVAYFVLVKMRDHDMKMLGQQMLEGFKRPPSVEELRRSFALVASLENRIALAQGLFDARCFEEALKYFKQVLEAEPNNSSGLYGEGCCYLELDDMAAAVGPLSKLVEGQPNYRDYSAWPDLAEALWKSREQDATLELLVDLVKAAPRLPHLVLRAQYLQRAGHSKDAARLLREALADHRDAPKHVRRQGRKAAATAKQMLADLA
ncbi:tetratricopeptide repeat protein [Desulfobulbus sp. AH-315-M07]|nr:tetratricopeptide repeat protein [Desulfobulbus sp. AH-315-M07]